MIPIIDLRKVDNRITYDEFYYKWRTAKYRTTTS